MNRLSLAERWMIVAGLILVAYFALDALFSVRNVERCPRLRSRSSRSSRALQGSTATS